MFYYTRLYIIVVFIKVIFLVIKQKGQKGKLNYIVNKLTKAHVVVDENIGIEALKRNLKTIQLLAYITSKTKYSFFNSTCLVRSLTIYGVASSLSLPAVIRCAFPNNPKRIQTMKKNKTNNMLLGHCWTEVSGLPIDETNPNYWIVVASYPLTK